MTKFQFAFGDFTFTIQHETEKTVTIRNDFDETEFVVDLEALHGLFGELRREKLQQQLTHATFDEIFLETWIDE